MYRSLSPPAFARAFVYNVAYTFARREIYLNDGFPADPRATIAAYWDGRGYEPSPEERVLAEAAIRDALAGRPAALP